MSIEQPIVAQGLRRRGCLAALAGAALVPWVRPARAVGVALPLHRLRTGDIGGLIGVSLELEGRLGIWLIDSGSTNHVIDAAYARRRRFPIDSAVWLASAGGRQRVLRVRLPALRLPTGEQLEGVDQALSVDLQPLRDVAGPQVLGVLGMPLLAGRITRFDLALDQILLDAPSTAASVDVIDVPLKLDSGLAVASVALSAGIEGEVLVDTGNAGAMTVFAHAAEGIVQDRSLPMLESRELGGVVSVAYARIEDFALGRFHRRELPLVLERGVRARRGGHFDRLLGSLGNAVFEGSSFDLDLAASRLRLYPGPLAGAAMPGGFGFAVAPRGDHLVLDRVLEGGPAAQAGLQPGDTVRSADGRTVSAAPAVLWAHLHERDDALFDMERDGAKWRVRLARSTFYPSLA